MDRVSEREWVCVYFPQQFLDALSIKEISPETFKSTLQDLTETLVRIIGNPNAISFQSALADAIKRAHKEAGNEGN